MSPRSDSPISWRLVLALSLAAALPLSAQSPQPLPPPTDGQKALLDQIQGVGDFKFGAKDDSFKPGAIKPQEHQNPTQYVNPGWQVFAVGKPEEITWGGLHPYEAKLTFFDHALIEIDFYFNAELGDLLAAENAFAQKYGASRDGGNITMPNGGSLRAVLWNPSGSGKIQAQLGLPETAPPRVDYLKQKIVGAVSLSDVGLIQKITQQNQDAAQRKFNQQHDLEKIKAQL